MAFKSLIGTVCTCLAVVSSNVSAALISADFETVGDNLITHDSISGLDWLDLSETRSLSYDYVSGQLGAGGQFDGFRYATTLEVIDLWASFGVDLSFDGDYGTYSRFDSGIQSASLMLGYTFSEFYSFPDIHYPYGVFGFTSSSMILNGEMQHEYIGAYSSYRESDDRWFSVYVSAGNNFTYGNENIGTVGSYLVKASVVPVPASAWLFSSGLLGLVGLARRKTV